MSSVSLAKKTVQKPSESLSSRIFAFDILRGYFLCVILLNHLHYYPSGLDFFTGRSILYVSTAEGFFLVSGIVLGIVRGLKLLNQSFLVGAKLLWKRALQLYITSIALTLLFTIAGQAFIDNPGLKWGIYADTHQWWPLIWDTITLRYTYGWVDFLRLYALFFFFAPLALWLLRKGYWYIILLVSVTVWALYPYVDPSSPFAQPLSWQLVFFAGFTIGFYWQKILAAWRSLSLQVRKTIGWSFVSIFIITAIISFILVFGHEFGGQLGATLDSIHHVVEQGYNKNRLPLPRLLLGTIWFWGLFFLVRRFETVLIRYTGWLLLRFGENSLYVYTISAFVVFFIHLILPPNFTTNPILNLIASLFAFSLVFVALKKRFLMKIIPR